MWEQDAGARSGLRGDAVPPGVTGLVVGTEQPDALELIAELAGLPNAEKGARSRAWRSEGREPRGASPLGRNIELALEEGAGVTEARLTEDATVLEIA